MKLVIEISEGIYNHMKERFRYGYADTEIDKVGLAVRNGKPLPKGHGRLIDGDSLKSCFHYGEANTNNENDMIMAVRKIIESVPTIIEADKEK